MPDGKTIDFNKIISETRNNKKVIDFNSILSPPEIEIGVKGSIADRHNNPGNLMYVGQEGAKRGEPKEGGGYWAEFDTPEAGYNALIKDIEAKQEGRTSSGLTGDSTVKDFFMKFSPPSENDTDSYIKKVSENLGVNPDTPIKDIDSKALAAQIAKQESGTIVNEKENKFIPSVEYSLPSTSLSQDRTAYNSNIHPLSLDKEEQTMSEGALSYFNEGRQAEQTLGEFLKEKNVSLKDLGLKEDTNTVRILREGERDGFNNLISLKGLDKQDKTSYFWGTVRAVNEGTASFFRTLDNASTVVGDITGVKKGGFFRDIASSLESLAEEMPNTPDDRAGRLLHNMGNLEGLFLELVITPEFKLGKLKSVPKLLTQMTGSGFVNRYADAASKDEDTTTKVIEGLKGAGTGAMDAGVLIALGYGSSLTGKFVTGQTGNVLAGGTTSVLTNAFGFGGTNAVEQLVTKGDIDWNEVEGSFDVGLALGVPGIAKAIGTRALGNYITSSGAAEQAARNTTTPVEKLRESSIELRTKSKEEQDIEKKTAMEVEANAIDAIADIKVVSEEVAKDPERFKKAIEKDDGIEDSDKKVFIEKIDNTAKELTESENKKLQEEKKLTETESQKSESETVTIEEKPVESPKIETLPKEELTKNAVKISEDLGIKKEEAKAKIAEGFSGLAESLGAKVSLEGEKRQSAIKNIQLIAEGLADYATVKGIELKQAVMEFIEKAGYKLDKGLIDEALQNKIIKDGRLFDATEQQESKMQTGKVQVGEGEKQKPVSESKAKLAEGGKAETKASAENAATQAKASEETLKTKQDAEKNGTSPEESSKAQGAEGETGERLRVRGNESDRVETRKGEEVKTAEVKDGKLSPKSDFLNDIEDEVTKRIVKKKTDALIKEKQKQLDAKKNKMLDVLEKIDKGGLSFKHKDTFYKIKKKADGTYSVSTWKYDKIKKKNIPYTVTNIKLKQEVLDAYKKQRDIDFNETYGNEVDALEKKYLQEIDTEIGKYIENRKKPIPQQAKKISEKEGTTEPFNPKTKTREKLPSGGSPVTVDEMTTLKNRIKAMVAGSKSGMKAMNEVKKTLSDLINSQLKEKDIDETTRGEIKGLLSRVKKVTPENIQSVSDEVIGLVEKIRTQKATKKLITDIKEGLKTKTIKTERGVKKAKTVSKEVRVYLEKAKSVFAKAEQLLKESKLTKNDWIGGLKGESKKQAEQDFDLAQEEVVNKKRNEFIDWFNKEIAEVEQKKLSDDPIIREQSIYEEIALRDFRNSMDINESNLIDISENLNRTIKEGREKLKNEIGKEISRRNEIKELAREATKTSLSGKTKSDIQQEMSKHTWKRLRYFFELAKEGFSENFIKPITTTFDFLIGEMESFVSERGEGKLYDYFMKGKNGWMESRDKEISRGRRIIPMMKERIKEFTGKKGIGINIAKWSEIKSDTGIYLIDKEGNRSKEQRAQSKNQGAYIYAISKMEGIKERLLEQGWDAEALAQNEKFIGDGIKGFFDWAQSELLPDLWKDYNETYSDIYLTPLDKVDNFFPLLYDAIGRTMKESELVIGENKFMLPSTIPNHIKSRVFNFNELSTTANAFETLFEYVESMEKFNAYARFTRDANILLTDPIIRHNLNRQDPKLYRYFSDTIKRAIGEEDYVKIMGIEKGFHKLNRAVAFSKIAFRTWTALKQTLSFPAWWENADRAYAELFNKRIYVPFVGTAEFAAKQIFHMNPVTALRDHRFFMNKEQGSNFYYDRVHRGAVGQEDISQWLTSTGKIGDTRKLFTTRQQYLRKKGERLILKSGILFNKIVDAYTIATGGKVYYDQQYKKYQKIGLSKEESHKRAMRDFDLTYNLVQQSAENVFISEAQANKGAMKSLFAVFKNSQFSYFRKFIQGSLGVTEGYAREKRKWKDLYVKQGLSEEKASVMARHKGLNYLTSKGAKSDFKKIAIYGWVMPIVWQYVASEMPGILTKWDDDDTEEMTRALVLGPLDGMYILSDLGESAYDRLVRGKSFWEYQPSLLIDQVNETLKDITQALGEDGDINWDVAYEIARQSFMYKGMDVENIDLIFDGAEELILNGEWNQENIMKLLAAPKGLQEGRTKEGLAKKKKKEEDRKKEEKEKSRASLEKIKEKYR